MESATANTDRPERDLVLVPYIEVNGAWTIPDEAMKGLYRLMEKEGTAKTVFPSGTIADGDQFLAGCRMKGVHTIAIIHKDGSPASMVWLKDFGRNSAYGHFCMFKNSWGKDTLEAGKMALEYFFGFKRPDGIPLLDLLIGVFPEENQRALEYVKKLGFTIIGIIPRMIYNKAEDRMVGAAYSYIERRN